ncbi:MAG: ISL3 family transposase [Deltaproteobacteria bacterium]|nr:ISL3 family transposase [Deltaproteobacteria bacterium]
MQIKSILNRVQLHPGFVYDAVRWRDPRTRMILDIEIRPRKGTRPVCSRCGRSGPGYDTLRERRFEFVPLWGLTVFFLYALRRVDCAHCGVKVERVPWAEGKNHLTTTYAWFFARWAKRLSRKEVAEVFHTTWDSVYRAVAMAVAWGLAHRNLDGVTAIGIDEIAWKKGHKYLTLVYQVDAGCKRLLWIGQERTQKTLRKFFKEFGEERTRKLRFVYSDMWKPYLRVVAELAGEALHILDRFHVMSHFGKAIDKVRATEARELKAKGKEPALTGSRWCLLKRPENLTDRQVVKLEELLAINLKTVRAYLLKEDFRAFWGYRSPAWAGKFLDDWCRRTMRSRLKPMKKIVKMLRVHREQLLNWFRCRDRIALGAVEGFNNKVKVTTRKSYGFRSFDVLKIALYHTIGKLPEPESTRKFC